MLNRVKVLLRNRDAARRDGGGPHDKANIQVAAAALLVEAAHMDDAFDAGERAKVLELVGARFGLSGEESESILEVAEEWVAQSSQLHGFTRVVKQAFNHAERVELLEMLWEVAYADGVLHDFEAGLIRRITGLLHVSDRENGAARKRAKLRSARLLP